MQLDNTNMAERARGTVKVVVFEGDTETNHSVAISICNSTPVHLSYSVIDKVI